MEGLQVPVEYYRDPDGRKVLVKGHRRSTACRILANRNTPNFTLDMKIPAIEVSDAPVKDLVVRAVADNAVRKSLDGIARIRAAVALHKAGVEDRRAAVALGVSPQSFTRDLLVGQHAWMFDHVLNNRVGPTAASQLLKTAVEAKREDQLRADLAAWIAAKEQEIQRKIKDRKDKGLKDLTDAEKQVKSYITGALVKHWVELIETGQMFDDHADWAFRAGFDPETKELTVGNFKTNVDKEDPKNLVRMIAQLSQVNKQLLPIAKKRAEEEKGAMFSPTPTAPYDFALLRQEGLGDFADELEKQLREPAQPATEGEDEPTKEQPDQ
jgi:ParB-like chromosome segregation protein Spo0J